MCSLGFRCLTCVIGLARNRIGRRCSHRGEQQRVAFARVLLTRPKAVFLDEATSALDEGLALALYELLRTELPDTIVVSISHRSSLEAYHERHLELLGEGAWRLQRFASKQ